MEKAKSQGGPIYIYSWTHWFIGWKRRSELCTLFEIQSRCFNKPALMFDCTCINYLLITFGLHNKQRAAIETYLNLSTSCSYLLGM